MMGSPVDTAGMNRRLLLRFVVALAISVALHFAIWRYKEQLEQRFDPGPKPINIIEVSLAAAPKPTPAPAPKAAEPASRKAESSKIEPKKAAPQSVPPLPSDPKPQQPKAEPKPKLQPRAEPAPKHTKPVPIEKPAKAEAEAARPSPKAEPPTVSAAPGRPSESPPVAAGDRPDASGEPSAQKSETFEAVRADAAYLHNPKPSYPAVARSRHWEGRVVLRVKVLPDGRCGEVAVQQGSGHDVLDEAALEAVRGWNFVSAKRGGRPVESWVNIPIVFKLER